MKKFFPLILIILLAAFLRLYKIEDHLHFLGDQGRDVLTVKRIIVDGKFTLLGPIASVGGFYLGPIYYYFMLPFLLLFNFNPVGPAVMIVLLSLLTIFLLYQLSLEFFNQKTAILASCLYAFSPFVIIYSRFSWNPNAVPFFGLLLIYGLLKIVVKNQTKWSYVVGLTLGILIQLHYLALVFGLLIFLILLLFRQFKISIWLKIILGKLITFSPFLIFELRHHFPNTKTIFNFVTRSGDSAIFSLNQFSFKLVDITTRAFWRIVVIESNPVSKFLMFVLGLSLFWLFVKEKELKWRKPLIVLVSWFLVSVVSLSLYKGAVYDYYMVIFLAFPALITGIVFAWLFSKNLILKLFILAFFLLFMFYQFNNSLIFKTQNCLLALTKQRASFILSQTKNQPYNFALLTASNSDHAYIYFLELWGKPPVILDNYLSDPERKTVTNQLFVICEIEDCQPLGHPLWEIAGFGDAEIVNVWEVAGVKIFKLVHLKR